jgi:hypothetical protein
MTPSHAQPFLVMNLSPKLTHLLRRSSLVDDSFLLLLVFFLVVPGPEAFDDQSQFRALLATDMPPWAQQQTAIVAKLHPRNASPRGVTESRVLISKVSLKMVSDFSHQVFWKLLGPNTAPIV